MPAERTETAATGECRKCRSFCDKMIEPRDCISMGCRYAYSHVDEPSGVEYMGCLRGVFRGEVAIDAVEGPDGFGGIKMTGQPLPHCQFRVERAYEGGGEAYDCVNKRFFDVTDEGPEGMRAFDLRDGLPASG